MIQDFETNKKRVERLRLTCKLMDDDGKVHHFQDGYEYIEIGGLKWATCNVGAKSITDYGVYFQWGDVQGYTADQVGCGEKDKYFNWLDYKYSNNGTMTKYNSSDGKTILDSVDDAARFHMGGSWRMPTEDDFRILLTNTTNKWTSINGISGRLFTSKADSSKTLFFPTCGYCSCGSIHYRGSLGFYWCSSLYSSTVVGGRRLFFDSVNYLIDSSHRCCGVPVRGVIG